MNLNKGWPYTNRLSERFVYINVNDLLTNDEYDQWAQSVETRIQDCDECSDILIYKVEMSVSV